MDRVLRLVGHGETGLTNALTRAAEVLAGSRASRRVVVLLSDCRVSDSHGEGLPAAVRAAQALDELVVLAPGGDSAEASGFARRAGARCAELTDAQNGPEVLDSLLAGLS